jgi:ribosomal protein L27
VAKAPYQNGSDSEGRRLGEQTGLDTRVVLAVNAASKALHILMEYAVS